MNFRRLLSPDSVAALNRRRALSDAFEAAPPLGKAAIMIDAARTVRDGLGIDRNDPRRSYNESFVLRVVPEIARRISQGRILLQPCEKQDVTEEGDPRRAMKNLNNADLAIYALSCVGGASYRMRELMTSDDPDLKRSPRMVKLADAIDMLTCHENHGNYALRAMLDYAPEETQAGIRSLPGRFNGLRTDINLSVRSDEGLDQFCVVVETGAVQRMIRSFQDIDGAEDLLSRLEAAWRSPEDVSEEDLERFEAEKVSNFLPGAPRGAPILAMSIVHRRDGPIRSFDTQAEDAPGPSM